MKMKFILLISVLALTGCGQQTPGNKKGDQPAEVLVKVAAYNVEYSTRASAQEIGEALKPYNFDAVAFSEAPGGDWTREVASILGMEYVVTGIYSTAGHKDKYKTIASRTPLYGVEEILMTDTLHTVTRALTQIDGLEIALYAVHFPFGWRDQAHIDETTAKIKSFVDFLKDLQQNEKSIVMGDFNFIPSRDNSPNMYHEMFKEIGLELSWFELGLDVTARNTHNALKAEDEGSGKLIDHVMYNPDIASAIDGGIIEMEKPLSDHKPVWTLLRFP
jgi:maltose 6'-phosphate phosphatase